MIIITNTIIMSVKVLIFVCLFVILAGSKILYK